MSINLEFPDIPKEVWLKKIKRDLKNQDLDAIHWKLDEFVSISPFQHPEDLEEFPDLSQSHPAVWLIGYECETGASDEVLNTNIITQLQKGVNAITVHIRKELDLSSLQTIFKHVRLDFIHTTFLFANPGICINSIAEFDQYITLQGYDPWDIQGSFIQHGLGSEINIPSNWHDQFPEVRFFSLSLQPEPNDTSKVKQLLNLVQSVVKLKEELNLSLFDLSAKLHIIYPVGDVYYAELCHLRALKWIWGLLAESFGEEQFQLPFIEAIIDLEGAEPNHDLIKAGTRLASAVQGGIHKGTIRFNLKDQEKQAFYNRLGINVHHLFQLENNLTSITDPAKGSYYLENLTRKIAIKVWENL